MPCSLRLRDEVLGIVAGGLDDLDAALDDRLQILGVRRRRDRGQDRQVHAERLVGHAAAALDLLAQILRRRLRQRGQDAEAAGIRDRGCQFGSADPLHAALNDRIFDAEQLGDLRSHR